MSYVTQWVQVISTTSIYLIINTGNPVGEESSIFYTLPTVATWFKAYWYVLFVLILFIVICLVALVLSIVRWRCLVNMRKSGGMVDEDDLYTSAGRRDRRTDSTMLVRSLSRSNMGRDPDRKRSNLAGQGREENEDSDEEDSSSDSDTE